MLLKKFIYNFVRKFYELKEQHKLFLYTENLGGSITNVDFILIL